MIASCRKNDIPSTDEPPIVFKNDFQFLHAHLRAYAEALRPILTSPEGRKLIREKVMEKFDEEYEVLIKDIKNIPGAISLVDNQKITELDQALFARSKEHLYPQIYIPHLQYLEDTGGLTRSTTDTIIEEPVLVFFSGNPEVDNTQNSVLYPGYKFVNGVLTFFTMVDELYANTHEVWVYNINEVVNRDGVYKLPLPDDEGGGGGSGVPTGSPDDDPNEAPYKRNPYPETGRATINFKIQGMRVAVHKESWISGSSEVAIRAKLHCHNDRPLGNRFTSQSEHYTTDQYSNYLGKLIKKVKRKDIRDATLMYVEYSLQRDWQFELPARDPIHFDYLIFERDPWPAKLNTFQRSGRYSIIFPSDPPSLPWNQNYRSSDNQDNTPYQVGTFTGNILLAASQNEYAGSGLVQGNGQIAFNTILYY
jgi:hypothetical protein